MVNDFLLSLHFKRMWKRDYGAYICTTQSLMLREIEYGDLENRDLEAKITFKNKSTGISKKNNGNLKFNLENNK